MHLTLNEIIDTIHSEFSQRFLEFNMRLIRSSRSRLLASTCLLDKENLQPLFL